MLLKNLIDPIWNVNVAYINITCTIFIKVNQAHTLLATRGVLFLQTWDSEAARFLSLPFLPNLVLKSKV